jgi:hypothetical protein
MKMRQSIESLCGLPEKESRRPLDFYLTRRMATDAEAPAALEARARKTAAAMLDYRVRDYIREPRQLDALETDPFQPRLSQLPPDNLRYRLAVLLGEELTTPRRYMSFGGETIRLNLRAAMIYAEGLCEIAGEGEI